MKRLSSSTSDWRLYAKQADFEALGRRHGISPLTARIMVNRGVPEEAFDAYLNGGIADMHDPRRLLDLDLAAAMLAESVREGVHIRVVGDYDIDGVCATYLLVTALRRIGGHVSFEIPDRVRDGYGINRSIIEQAHEDGVGLVLTCDNGIAAFEAAELARSYGMKMIVTDHHEVPVDGDGREKLPPADVIADPKRAEDTYPFREICGGMIAWKLVGLLYERCSVPEEEWRHLLCFAAIATVGDVMPLQDENRIAVRLGLRDLARGDTPGLDRLIALCGLDRCSITAYQVGFVIGP